MLPDQKLTPSSTVPSIVLLRGVAALSVMCFHLIGQQQNSPAILRSVFNYGYLGVYLFFIISGFIVPYSMYVNRYRLRNFPGFFLRRIVRIEPPYVFSILIIICFLWYFAHDYGFPYVMEWKRFFLHFGYVNRFFGYESYTGVYWTLGIEFQFYILIALLLPLILRYGNLLTIILLAAFNYIYLTRHWEYSWFVFQYSALFVAGILLFLYYIGRMRLVLFIVLYLANATLLIVEKEMLMFYLTLLAAPAILLIKWRSKITDFFGNISYSLYLTHLDVAGMILYLLLPVMGVTLKSQAISFIGAIIFAVLFHYAAEKPFQKLSKKIRY